MDLPHTDRFVGACQTARLPNLIILRQSFFEKGGHPKNNYTIRKLVPQIYISKEKIQK